MNDDELMTTVRDSFSGIHSATPLEQIVRRSHTVRVRRRLPGVAGVLALAAGAAVAAATLLGGQQPSRPITARLAAWTVTKQGDGTITVTIRQLHDPAGLQRTLRADGVPVSVTFFGRPNPACRSYPARPGQPRGEGQGQTITQPIAPGVKSSADAIARFASLTNASLIIDPSDLPKGAGLQVGTGLVDPHFFRIWTGLVQVGQQCTGS